MGFELSLAEYRMANDLKLNSKELGLRAGYKREITKKKLFFKPFGGIALGLFNGSYTPSNSAKIFLTDEKLLTFQLGAELEKELRNNFSLMGNARIFSVRLRKAPPKDSESRFLDPEIIIGGGLAFRF